MAHLAACLVILHGVAHVNVPAVVFGSSALRSIVIMHRRIDDPTMKSLDWRVWAAETASLLTESLLKPITVLCNLAIFLILESQMVRLAVYGGSSALYRGFGFQLPVSARDVVAA